MPGETFISAKYIYKGTLYNNLRVLSRLSLIHALKFCCHANTVHADAVYDLLRKVALKKLLSQLFFLGCPAQIAFLGISRHRSARRCRLMLSMNFHCFIKRAIVIKFAARRFSSSRPWCDGHGACSERASPSRDDCVWVKLLLLDENAAAAADASRRGPAKGF